MMPNRPAAIIPKIPSADFGSGLLLEMDPMNSAQRFDVGMSNHENPEILLDPKAASNLYHTSFKFNKFLKYYLHHFVYFFVLGPLIFLLTPIFGKYELRNQMFIGWTSTVFSQALIYLGIGGFLIAYYVLHPAGVHPIEIYMIITVVLLRIVNISSKYAFSTTEFLQEFESRVLTRAEFKYQLLLGNFLSQDDAIIEDELEAAMYRQEVDGSIFFFGLLSQMESIEDQSSKESPSQGSSETAQKDLIRNKYRKKSKFTISTLAVERFHNKKSAFVFLKKLFKEGREKVVFEKLKGVIRLISLIRALIPSFYRLYLGEPFLTSAWYIEVPLIISNCLLFSANTIILSAGIFHQQVIWHPLYQLGFMVSHDMYNPEREYPVLNFFDIVSLKSWSNMRNIVMNYSEKFQIRASFNLTVTLLFYMIVFLIFLIQIFGIVNIYNDPLMLIIFGFETFIYLLMFLISLLLGALINQEFSNHQVSLKKTKTIVIDFQRLSSLYLGPNCIQPAHEFYQQGLENLKKGIKEDQDAEIVLRQNCEDLLAVIDNVIDDIELQSQINPYTILGIPATFPILKSIAVGIFSLIFAIIQKLMQQ